MLRFETVKILCAASVWIVFFCMNVEAQELQRTSFSFLNVAPTARVSGLGGVNVSLADRDVNLFFSNPALVGDSLQGYGSLNYQFFVADIGNAAFSYLPRLPKLGTVAIGIQHFSYGTIKGFDPAGTPTGDFSASETAIVISKSHQINHFRLGASLKGAFSSLAGFRSSALMLDLGGVFIHPERDLHVGLAVKNLGLVLSDYSGTSESALPLDVQIGATFRPMHMPLRFSLTAYRLIQSKAVNYDQALQTQPSTLQKIFRHFNFGAELLLHRNVNILFGYNYGVHQELKIPQGGGAGLSVGFSARVKSVEFIFSRSTFVAGAAGYALTLSMDAKKMFRRSV
jgi:hypothetical protein